MKRAIKIYDTTLRDGTQGEGISFSVTDKLRIAERLDQFGIDYIEGGFPGSNPRDITFFNEARHLRLKHARLAAFGSTRRAGAKASEDPQLRTLLDSQMPVLTLVGKTWLLHVTEILRTTPEENLAMIEDSIRYLVAQGREVIYDAELRRLQGQPRLRDADSGGRTTRRSLKSHALRYERRHDGARLRGRRGARRQRVRR